MEERPPIPFEMDETTEAAIQFYERMAKIHRKNDRIWPAQTHKSPHRQRNRKKTFISETPLIKPEVIVEIAKHTEEDYDPNHKEQADYPKILYKLLEKEKRG